MYIYSWEKLELNCVNLCKLNSEYRDWLQESIEKPEFCKFSTASYMSERITESHNNTFSTFFFFSNALRRGGNHRVIYNAVNG